MVRRQDGADSRQALGFRGEEAAAAWYEASGYEVLERNWRTRDGELDLIVGRGRLVVFCEVKTRSSNAFGTPAEAVDRQKRQRVRMLAARWLEGRPRPTGEVRFDVAAVMPRPGGDPVVEIIEGAF